MGLFGTTGEDGRQAVLLTPRHAAGELREYGERWGYAVLPAAPATRLLLVRSALREARLVLWLDADVRPPRQDEDLAGLLRPRAFQALARTADGRPDPGVWLLRSCPAAVTLLQAAALCGSLEAALPEVERGTTWLPGRWGPRTAGVLARA